MSTGPARRLIRALAAGALCLPGVARAMGPHDFVYAPDLVFDAVFLLGPLALAWAVHAGARAALAPRPAPGFFPVAAQVLALWLGVGGMLFARAFAQLFASFGADLPAPALILIQYPYVLLAPAAAVFAAQWLLLRRHPLRGRFLAAIAAAEYLLLLLVYFSLHMAVFTETAVE